MPDEDNQDAEIRRRLHEAGFKDDELSGFDTPEKLREFYEECRSAGRMHEEVTAAADAEETEPEPVDDFRLSEADILDMGLNVRGTKGGRISCATNPNQSAGSIIDVNTDPEPPKSLKDMLDEPFEL